MEREPAVGQSRRVVLDMDRKHFYRHVSTIKTDLEALNNLYLSPRIKGALQDLGTDLDAIAAEREAEL